MRQYGQYAALAPRVAPAPNERLPLHVNVELARAANVAVFLVVPGRGTVLLFPDDSVASSRIEAGPHLLATSYAKRGVKVDSNLARRPDFNPLPSGETTRGRAGSAGRAGFPSDTSLFGRGSISAHSFLLVYATDQPLSYSALTTRVAALSIPIEDTEALNTVTKLIRDATRGTSPWAAYATEFTP